MAYFVQLATLQRSLNRIVIEENTGRDCKFLIVNSKYNSEVITWIEDHYELFGGVRPYTESGVFVPYRINLEFDNEVRAVFPVCLHYDIDDQVKTIQERISQAQCI